MIEAFVSVPRATGANPAATAAQDPDDDPPVLYLAVSCSAQYRGSTVHYVHQSHHPIFCLLLRMDFG